MISVAATPAASSALDLRRRPPRPPRRDSCRRPSCSTGRKRSPVPSGVVRVGACTGRAAAAPRRTPPRCSRRRRGGAGRCARGRARGRAGSSRARRAGAVSTETPAPSGCVPCSTCASCCGSPTSTRFRAAGAHRERVGERDLAGLVDEQVVERRRRGRSRAKSQAVPPSERRVARSRRASVTFSIALALVERLRVAGARLLDALRPIDPAPPRPRRAACGSPCGSSRRRRRACPARAGARSAARTSRSCPSRAGPGSRGGRPSSESSERRHLVEVGRLHVRSNGSRRSTDSSAG